MKQVKPVIQRRIDIRATIEAMPPSSFAVFRARDFATYAAVRTAVSRLNDGLTDPIYAVTSNDNGETYTITRYN